MQSSLCQWRRLIQEEIHLERASAWCLNDCGKNFGVDSKSGLRHKREGKDERPPSAEDGHRSRFPRSTSFRPQRVLVAHSHSSHPDHRDVRFVDLSLFQNNASIQASPTRPAARLQLYIQSTFFPLSFPYCTFPVERTSIINHSPAAQIPAAQSNNREVIQKKLIDWPISSHDPVSCTL